VCNSQAGKWLVQGHPIHSLADVPLLHFRVVNPRYFQALRTWRDWLSLPCSGSGRATRISAAIVRTTASYNANVFLTSIR
jgi:hypothetical protein